MAENPDKVVILLERDPKVEKLVKVKEQEKDCCFLCGKSDTDESPLTSCYLTGPRKSAYLDQVGLFKRLLSKREKISMMMMMAMLNHVPFVSEG